MQLNNQAIHAVICTVGDVTIEYKVGNKGVERIMVREAINSGGYKINIYTEGDTVTTPYAVILTNQVMIEYKRKHHEPVGLDL